MFDYHYEQNIQLLLIGQVLEDLTTSQKNQLVVRAVDFQLITRQLYKMGLDEILRRHVLPHEQERILFEAPDGIIGGHDGGLATARKVLWAGLWWPTMYNDVMDYAKSWDVCQRMRKPSQWDEMLLVP